MIGLRQDQVNVETSGNLCANAQQNRDKVTLNGQTQERMGDRGRS